MAPNQCILYCKVPELLGIIEALKQEGIKQGVDFEFRYNAARYNNDGYEPINQAHVVFTFHNETYASWFKLKWG